MPVGRYARPPITEAVIEFRFGSPLSDRMVKRFLHVVAKEYPTTEQTYEISAQLRITGPGQNPEVSTNQSLTGYKLTGQDSADFMIFRVDRIGIIRNSPYCGWNNFFERAKSYYEKLKKISGLRSLTRIATRYVNRLDIPVKPGDLVRSEDYLQIEPLVPTAVPRLSAFFTTFRGIVPEIEGQVIVNSGTVQSPLIDHISFLLDIDLFREQALPQRDQDVWDLLDRLRAQKNALFESFVTDRARELFDRA
ncbi:MAG TPA: TIGR04255 family protein [Stellaceae bacterium]|nr:TIGR04255 family protein [Stellaceae bacterium]